MKIKAYIGKLNTENGQVHKNQMQNPSGMGQH